MRKILCSVLFFYSILSAQPRIVVPKSGQVDFGEIYSGSKVTRTVAVRNEGTDTLKISSVTASCGCTAALVTSGQVPPHDSTVLTITFTSGTYLGKVGKSVTVSSNDPVDPKKSINFLIDIRTVLKMTPQFIYYGETRVDSTIEKSVRLQNTTAEVVRILSVTPKDSQITSVHVGQKTLNPGEETDLVAAFHPRRAGYVQGEIEVLTDYKAYPALSLSFNAQPKAAAPPSGPSRKK